MKKTSVAIILSTLVIVLTLFFSVKAFAAEDICAAEEITVEGGEETFFDALYEACLTNADKIFSLLAFGGSLVTVIAYRKGLLPLLTSGLRSLKKSSDEIEKKSKESVVSTEKTLSILTDRFVGYENSLTSLCEAVEALSERLVTAENAGKTQGLIKEVMLGEIDMLYEIFISSSLPQYSKDAISERVAKMKKILLAGEDSEKE